MSLTTGHRALAVLFTLGFATLFSLSPARAQCAGRQSQQSRVQTSGSPGQSSLRASLQQQLSLQQASLQTTLQQTNDLLTALQQQDTSADQTALLTALQQQQVNVQAALQQTNTLLASLRQGGRLTPAQVQSLRRLTDAATTRTSGGR